MPLTDTEWADATVEDGDLPLILTYLQDQHPRAFTVRELQQEEGLPILYQTQFKDEIESDAEAVADQLIRIYYRLALEALVYHGMVEVRRRDGLTYYRAT